MLLSQTINIIFLRFIAKERLFALFINSCPASFRQAIKESLEKTHAKNLTCFCAHFLSILGHDFLDITDLFFKGKIEIYMHNKTQNGRNAVYTLMSPCVEPHLTSG